MSKCTKAAQEFIASYPGIYEVIADRAQEIAVERYYGILASDTFPQYYREHQVRQSISGKGEQGG